MTVSHLPKERLLGMMIGTITPTEEESTHVLNWSCPECTKVMHEAVAEHIRNLGLDPPKV